MELEGLTVNGGRRVCSKQPRRVDRRRCRQQARPSTSFVENTIELLRRNFLSPEFGANIQGEVSLFLEIPEFRDNTV